MPKSLIKKFKKPIEELLGNLITNPIPLTLDISDEEKDEALYNCEQYLNGQVEDISTLPPLSIYYILSKLSEERQLQFIKNNINYLKEHDSDIFLYHLEEPKELVTYLSYKVLTEIYNQDQNLFQKIVSKGHPENIFYGFKEEDYYSYLKNFKPYITERAPVYFFNMIVSHNRHLYNNLDLNNLKRIGELQETYNQEFITYIAKNYQDYIDTFNPQQLLTFISYIQNIEQYQQWIIKNKQILKQSFKKMTSYDLEEYLIEYTNSAQQEILFNHFLEEIAIKQDIRKIIPFISIDETFRLYKKDKTIFSKMTLDDWLKLSSKKHEFNKEFINILDNYPISNIENLFDHNFYRNEFTNNNTKALEYIEKKYRSTLDPTSLIPTNIINSIFSSNYFNNLKYLQTNLKNKYLTKTSKEYEESLAMFIHYLKKYHIITELDNTNLLEIDTYFYLIIMSYPISSIFNLNTINDIVLINRTRVQSFDTTDFTIEQLKKYNIKEHNQLISMLDKKELLLIYRNRRLLLKLLLLVGFTNSKKILQIDHNTTTLEHLVGNVDVKHITFDKQNNPILNPKLMNLLFSNPTRIEEILKNQDSDAYKYFPRFFNDWEQIKLSNKNNSLKEMIEFLKTDEISLTPDYYRLNGLFKYIGSKNTIIEETKSLHDETLKRTTSTIPKIKRQLNEYTYEVLDLQDMEGLILGSQTQCCFTILGNGYSCLKHAFTSQNGRILVVKKNNHLLAHSWIWRNGNLLCIDNIEVSKSVTKIDFLELYLDFANQITKISRETEGTNNCITNITIGYNNYDKVIVGIEDYLCYINKSIDLNEAYPDKTLSKRRIFTNNLPHPIEEVKYSDSKNVQYLIKGDGIFNLFQSNYLYQDIRKDIFIFENNTEYPKEYIDNLTKIINSLRYIKHNLEKNSLPFHYIDIENYKSIICNDDWYIIEDNKGIDTFIYSNDKRAYQELEEYKTSILKYSRKLKKIS